MKVLPAEEQIFKLLIVYCTALPLLVKTLTQITGQTSAAI
jgi:hypothetical protein